MRQPLKKQTPPRGGRRYSAYQKRIFLYLVTLVTAPLLLLGVLSSVVYYRQTVTRSDALLTSARENVEAQMEIALSNLRAYYSAVVSTDYYQTLCQKTVPPYSEYTLVRDMQNAMRGGNLVDKYVEGYTHINLRSGWVLSNNGTYRLADAANREEVAHLLGEWAEQHAAMMWVNRTEYPTPAWVDTPLNTVDLTGELLVLRSSSYRTGSYAVLIVKLDLSPLYEMTESWQTGGYSIAARDFTGKTVLSTSDALTALLDADTPAEGACVQDGWRLNSGRRGVNGLTYYAALPQRTLAATAGTVILIAFALEGVLVAVLLICRRHDHQGQPPAHQVHQQGHPRYAGQCQPGRPCAECFGRDSRYEGRRRLPWHQPRLDPGLGSGSGTGVLFRCAELRQRPLGRRVVNCLTGQKPPLP